MSSWWCAIHGYAVPELDAAVREQLESMSHVMFGGLTHEPAVALGERLVARAPRSDRDPDRVLDKVFLADSGSVSVEVAMKMAWQSHAAHGLTRTKFFTIAGGYHGDTFAPMSVTDPQGGMHSMYAGLVPEHVFAPPSTARPGVRPLDRLEELDDDRALRAARRRDRRRHHRARAAGRRRHAHLRPRVRPPPRRPRPSARRPGDLRRDRHRLLAHRHRLGRRPLRRRPRHPLRRQGADRRVHDPRRRPHHRRGRRPHRRLARRRDDARPHLHGEPARLRRRLREPRPPRLPRQRHPHHSRSSRRLCDGLEPARELAAVADVRVLGAVGVVELDRPVDVRAVTEAALEAGVWVRPFRNLVYTMPPFVSTADDLATITSGIVGAVAKAHP